MNQELAESLAKALRTRRWERDAEILRRALEQYAPSNLSELYMAVRATSAADGSGLVETLICFADSDPECPLSEFLIMRTEENRD